MQGGAGSELGRRKNGRGFAPFVGRRPAGRDYWARGGAWLIRSDRRTWQLDLPPTQPVLSRPPFLKVAKNSRKNTPAGTFTSLFMFCIKSIWQVEVKLLFYYLSFLKSLPTLAGKPVPISVPSHKATLSYSANIGCCSMSNAGRLVLLDWTFSAPSCNWPQCPILVVTAPSDEGESWMVAKKGNKMSWRGGKMNTANKY